MRALERGAPVTAADLWEAKMFAGRWPAYLEGVERRFDAELDHGYVVMRARHPFILGETVWAASWVGPGGEVAARVEAELRMARHWFLMWLGVGRHIR